LHHIDLVQENLVVLFFLKKIDLELLKLQKSRKFFKENSRRQSEKLQFSPDWLECVCPSASEIDMDINF